ncbi:hypothetical protein [Alkalihalobacillus sp. 1P02AB]|uniref:hypothetical protein n=1 Tax=Alkalihalobacillus sp. 1P02AB TaxID=3132260 RepID=UPI0039A54493
MKKLITLSVLTVAAIFGFNAESTDAAYDTGISMSHPSSISGANANTSITLNFSGDRGTGNLYRWVFIPGDGSTNNSGQTSATRVVIPKTYSLINRDIATYRTQANVSGFSYANTAGSIRHTR